RRRPSAIRFMLACRPVRGSISFAPILKLKGLPGRKIYGRFAAMRGLRYTEIVGFFDCRPYVGCVLHPVGSLITSIVNSGLTGVPSKRFGGHASGILNSP